MMSSRTFIMILGFPSSAILLGAALIGNHIWLGLLVGYLVGIINIQWLFRDIKQVAGKDINLALRRYYISFYSRLGMITLVVVMVARFWSERLYCLVFGIIVGVFIPLIVIICQYLKHERG
ncbi:MAG: ATP synthase subunit I [Peptococcaceae bacterium]|nr:ATP synthase subunit I [Peptococcaceae bacterium]